MIDSVIYQDHQEKPSTSFRLASEGSSSNGNVVYGNHKAIYQDLSVIKTITKAKFPVYLVSSRITKCNYGMKVFAYENDQENIFFKNETRFASLRHPNVVRSLYSEKKRKASFDGMSLAISYTIMEYAQHGDFYNFLKHNNKDMDDKLGRTYFRQLIDGLEYLHNNEVAHMDIKLDNLLLDENFNLRITDFDLAHYADDAIIISNGTKFYRAPEVVQGRCNNPKSSDIYSAGIVLFTLKTKGVLPQFESNVISGINFAELLYNDTGLFWDTHIRAQKSNSVEFEDDFKELFIAMTRLNPNDRASIDSIKESKWYNRPYYTNEGLKEKMQRIYNFSLKTNSLGKNDGKYFSS